MANTVQEGKGLKLLLRGLKQVNTADKQGKGMARARGLKAQTEKIKMYINGANVQVQDKGRAAVEPECKWHLTSNDMISVTASVTLSPGILQTLRTCSMGAACTYKHSQWDKALNRHQTNTLVVQ